MTHSNDSTGPYELLEQLGQDALTAAFAARRRGASGVARLELLHPELTRNERFRARFLDQAAAMLSLSHPVLPRVLEVLAEPDGCGVALEFVPGRSLTEILQRTGRLRCPVDLHVYWLRQVLGGLEHAQHLAAYGNARAAFVHGDVCPNRVHVGHTGEVQLLGGGLAACRHALSGERGRPAVDVRYAAPEVLLGEPAGPSADLFSLGVMLWEALGRQARSTDTDPNQVTRRRTLGNEPDLESVWPDAPDAVLQLCRRALAVAPHDRYASAAEMAADLDAILARAAEPPAAVRARVPAWLTATFGELDDRWAPAPSSNRDRERLSSRRTLSSFPPPMPELDTARSSAPAAAAPSPPPPSAPPPPAPELQQRPSDTGGHRAFSSTWISPPPQARSSVWPTARAAFPALAVALGAVAAVWVVVAQRAPADRGAASAAALAALPSPLGDERANASARPVQRAAAGTADAGVEAAPDPREANSDRHARSLQRTTESPPLALDELPRVDDARDSLQAAIVRAARAQRRALRQRRAKPPAAPAVAPAELPSEPAPREIDMSDPYNSGELP